MSGLEEKFERAVNDGLLACGIDLCTRGNDENFSVGAAVSGGADSVAMMVSLAALCQKNHVRLHVLTVNHNIRDEKESLGDADFVRGLCAKLSGKNFLIDCTVKEIPRGVVERTAAERKGGVEEAARFLRYRFFDEFAKERGVSCVCIAHTQDDNIETVLMRFLQGGSGSGIARRRGIFVRPLLDVTRAQIEEYLKRRGVSWRTDSTNSDTNFFRNRIRHKLVPRLDEIQEGWRQSVLTGAERARDAEDAVARAAQEINVRQKDGCVFFEKKSFAQAPRAARLHALYDALVALGVTERVPYRFLADAADMCVCGSEMAEGMRCAGVEAVFSESELFLKKQENRATDFGFFNIIQSEGEYNLHFGKMLVYAENKNDVRVSLVHYPEKNSGEKKSEVGFLRFPFCVRSRMAGDEILDAAGKMRSVADILAAWKVPADVRDEVPIIQDLSRQEIVAVCGGVYGYDDWVVR